mgnify:CR=1 FL=1
MERKINFCVHEHYHLYSRGVEKRKIFLNERDYDRFLSLLYIMNQRESFHVGNFLKTHNISDIFDLNRGDTLVDILAYVLMQNHFHILVYEKEEGGITKLMSKVLTAYSMYFNKRYERSGPLFMHPFRAQYISEDNQYTWIFEYIHMNPIKIIKKDFKERGISSEDVLMCEEFLENYKYSSYQDVLGIERAQNKILNIDSIPDFVLNTRLNLEYGG